MEPRKTAEVRYRWRGGTSVGDPLEFKTWYHVAVAFDGEKVRFYTNGEKIEEVPQEKPTPDTQAEMQIGNSPVGVRPFQGIIDEVRIWSRALSDDEILEQMKIGTKQLIPVNPRAKLSTTWAEIKDIPVKPSRQAP
ncbi:TPA: LamG domain-containing protein [Candidatus Poribacteria bacterium]|nr:LamG domain-containing protein [Candidatus Poribacteria bacterium]